MEHLFVPYQATEIFQADSVLVLSPHPDDEVFGCGGAIIRHVQAGIPLKEIIVSDGGHGWESKEKRREIVAIRRQESICASRVMGCSPPVFWKYRDREVPYNEEIVNRIIAAVEETGADLIYAPSVFEIHPDHRAVALSTLEAVRRIDREVCLAMYEVGMPVRPDVFLDITDTCKVKERAMQCFTSQILIQDYNKQIQGLNRYRSYTLSSKISAAEAYLMVSSDKIKDDIFSVYKPEDSHRLYLSVPVSSNQQPMVSVLVRSMGRKELPEALDSIALQTYPNIEIILVNALGPGHAPMSRQYGRFPLHFVDSNVPLSRSKAANRALENATGEFLLFLDDDDLFFPDHVSNLVTVLSQNPDRKVAYSSVRCIDEAGKPTGIEFRQSFDPELLMAGNYIPVHAVMFSMDIIKAGCRIDENFDLYEDWDFWIQAAQHTDFIFIDKVTALYRTGGYSGSGIMPDTWAMHQAGEKIFEKWQSKWNIEKLNHVLSRVEEKKLNQGFLHKALDVLAADKHVQSEGCRIAFIVHVFYPDIWREISRQLNHVRHDFDLFVTCSLEGREEISTMVTHDFPHAVLRIQENRGRDILPFLSVLPDIIQKDYLCVCKLHTKQSNYEHTDGIMWRRDILNKLIGDGRVVADIISRFACNPRLGIIGPHNHMLSCDEYMEANPDRVLSLARQMMPFLNRMDWNFFAGSMFWFRPDTMVPLMKLGLTSPDFDMEKGQKEGTLAHAVERVFVLSAMAAGFDVEETVDCQGERKAAGDAYPYAVSSSYYLLEEIKTLRQQIAHVEEALQEAAALAEVRLEKMHEQEDASARASAMTSILIEEKDRSIKELENALSHASNLAIERLEIIKQQDKALSHASKLASQRLELMAQMEAALSHASKLAEEREKALNFIDAKLQPVRSAVIFRLCRKIGLVPDV